MWPGTWMTSCLDALRIWGIWKKAVSWDSSLEEGSRFSEHAVARPVDCDEGAARSGVQMEKSA